MAGGSGLGTARSPRPLQSTANCVPAGLKLKQMHTCGHCAAALAHSRSSRKEISEAVHILQAACGHGACLRLLSCYCTRIPRWRLTGYTEGSITQSQLRDKGHCKGKLKTARVCSRFLLQFYWLMCARDQ